MRQNIIPIMPIVENPTKVRVAAYVRVSTSKDDQLNSFAAQYIHYKKLFEDSTYEELIDIYSDAHNRATQGCRGERVLDKYADQLSVADIDVVCPLYPRPDAILQEHIDERQRHNLRHRKLLANRHKGWLQHHREGQVLTFSAMPLVPPLTTPSGLVICPHDIALVILFVTSVIVGRSGYVEVVYHINPRILRFRATLYGGV